MAPDRASESALTLPGFNRECRKISGFFTTSQLRDAGGAGWKDGAGYGPGIFVGRSYPRERWLRIAEPRQQRHRVSLSLPVVVPAAPHASAGRSCASSSCVLDARGAFVDLTPRPPRFLRVLVRADLSDRVIRTPSNRRSRVGTVQSATGSVHGFNGMVAPSRSGIGVPEWRGEVPPTRRGDRDEDCDCWDRFGKST
jgi:hypothetical protein